MKNVEIDVYKESQVNDAINFAHKYKCPAIIISPELCAAASITRGLKNGKFKIITQIDWDRGDQYHHHKFRGLPTNSLDTDGYEVLLTATKNIKDIPKEISYIHQILRSISPMTEIRFVLGHHLQNRNQEHFDAMCEACLKIPLPHLIRTTTLNKLPSASNSVDAYNTYIKSIRDKIGCKIKISGSINTKVYTTCKSDFFACTLDQAISLQNDIADRSAIAAGITDAIEDESNKENE